MQYEQYVITPFEKNPNRWRAKIRRADGFPILIRGPKKLDQFVTGIDCESAQAALLAAMAAIDAGTFSRKRTATQLV
jgi:hypothetical protein